MLLLTLIDNPLHECQNRHSDAVAIIMFEVLAVADDLTGALEAGAQFAGQGLPAIVTLHRPVADHRPVQVIDTETRHLAPEVASALILQYADVHARIIYKKTDSSLRGNIAAELIALRDLFSSRRIVYIPAYPALGRTVRKGELLVNGTPVHRTEFAKDMLNPVSDSSVHRLLATVGHCAIYDGETDNDVAHAVTSALHAPASMIIAGPASVAAEIARQIEYTRVPVQSWPRIQRCLIVNGSTHPVSRQQIDHAERNGNASAALGSDWQILPVCLNANADPLEVATQTGRVVREHLNRSPVDALFIFGGDTAFGILQSVGCPLLEPLGEVVPGVPLSRVLGQDLFMITKAGGFGQPDVIARTREILNATRN